MVDTVKLDGWKNIIEHFSIGMSLVSRQEFSLILITLHKCMCGIAVGLNLGQPNRSILIRDFVGFSNAGGTVLNGVFIDGFGVFYGEGNIFNAITMLDKMIIHILVRVLVVNRA